MSELEEFVCQRCGNCCRGEGRVNLTPEDVDPIADFFGLTREEFLKQFAHQTAALIWLKEKPDLDCIFLEGNLCRIHPVKPQQCRDFPSHWRNTDTPFECKGLQQNKNRQQR